MTLLQNTLQPMEASADSLPALEPHQVVPENGDVEPMDITEGGQRQCSGRAGIGGAQGLHRSDPGAMIRPVVTRRDGVSA